jgi:enediyne biosynthesis protein E4
MTAANEGARAGNRLAGRLQCRRVRPATASDPDMPRPTRLLLAVFLAAGCARPPGPGPIVANEPDGPPWFEDVTDRVGLTFRHHAGPTGSYFMPQVMGSGVALLDADNDGRLDILLLNNSPGTGAQHALFLQQPDGTFRDASAGSGLDVAGHGMGVAVGDFDNDGRADVYISQYGGGRLFRNLGGGRFEDVTAAAAVALPHWGTSCAFLDYDRDGWLDLVVVNYVDYDPSQPCVAASGQADFCHPRQFPGTAARLFRNRALGADGRWAGYVDVTAEAGLAGARGNGLGVACADFTGDGWPDIFVANDARPNHLWVNQHDGTFKEEAVARTVAHNAAGNVEANMGVVAADLAGAGRLDLFVTHLAEERHTLWRQDVPGRFRDETAASGLGNPRWRGTGFGTAAADFDHDGWLDLAVVNGRVTRSRLTDGAPPADLSAFWQPYAERNQLFAGTGGGQFRDVSPDSPAFAGRPGVYRGLAWGDLDNDGAMDLVVSAVEGPARVYRNVAPKKGHWVGVRALDPGRNRDALGAAVTVAAGGRTWLGLANPGQSYCSSGDPRVHFGLGPAAAVDEFRVDWPDGTREVFAGGPADRYVTLARGRGRPVK